MGEISFTSTAKIRENSILVYKRCDNPPFKSEEKKKELREKAKKNLLQNQDSYKYNGEPGKSATKKIRSMIDNWHISLKYQFTRNGKKKIKSRDRKRLTFVTLTLSASQEHTDNEIKRKLLDNFILTLKRKFKVKNYVWRAELQKNGNIHFHFVLDVYIHFERLRNIWNKLQEKLGYISRFEKIYGHKDPNSTDVRAVRSSTLLGVYISKYITKKERKREKSTARKRMSRFNKLRSKLNYKFSVKKIAVDKGIKRVLQGRVWGASEELKNICDYEMMMEIELSENWNTTTVINWEFMEVFNKLIETKKYKEISVNEYCKIYCFDEDIGKLFGSKYEDFYKKMFNDLYY